MFFITYLKFASNILSLDKDSFEKIFIVIVLGGKRLLWKPIWEIIWCFKIITER
jgi:hypothetical protein